MAHLARAKKIDLLSLAADLGLSPEDNSNKSQLINLIATSEKYDEELVKNLLIGIVEERQENEKKISDEKAEDRAYALKKLELENSAESKNETQTFKNSAKTADVLKLINKFDNKDDISLYLTLFERQVKRLGVEKESWVTYLIGLMPLDIVHLISRVDEDLANDYDHIKGTLLKRFQLSPEEFRQKFFAHKKENLASWRDFSFELSNFLDEWLNGLKLFEYDQVKSIWIVDQIRRKLPFEMREHFVDELPKFTDVSDFVEKLDEYESARNSIRKNSEPKNPTYEEKRRFSQNMINRNLYRNNVRPQKNIENNTGTPKIKCFQCNEFGYHKSNQCPRRKEGLICFKCKGSGHKADQCVYNNIKNVSTTTKSCLPSEKIIKGIEIEGKKINCIVDSGSDVTMINNLIYKDLGRPELITDGVKFTGISGEIVRPTGFFKTNILIDNLDVYCDVYVLNNLQYDMILGNNCLTKLNFEISDSGLRVTGKRNKEKNYNVNLLTVVPMNISKPDASSGCLDMHKTKPNSSPTVHMTNPDLRLDTLNISKNEECLKDTPLIKSIYLTDIANCISVNEVDTSHILNSAIKEELINVVENYKPNKIKNVDLKVKIILSDDIPVAQRPRRLAFAEQTFVDAQIQEWLGKGVIRESNSRYAAPIVLAKKKSGNLRLCVDYRSLNKKIIRDNYPLPVIDEVLDNIEQNTVFSTLDLKNGFFHVDVEESSKQFTSFVTSFSQFEFSVLPFGLSLGPQSFQKYIYACLKELIRDKTILIYLDDILVLARSEEEALLKLKRVFQVASEYGLEFNFAKCQFLKKKIEFLGYIIENGTIRPSEKQTLAVQKFPEPQNKKQLQSFLGLSGYFRRYIADYATLARPLSDILKAENDFNFGPSQREAFEILKSKLASKPVLHIFRQGAETELHTDASSLGFGAVLLQKDECGNLHPVHYLSRKTTPAQAKYSSYELEALAVIEAVKKFRTYLLGHKFKIVTDCSAFQKTLEKKELAPKVARWALFLQEFNYQIVHRAGNQMKHVDALSRNTVLVITRSYDEITAKLAKMQEEDDYIKTIKVLIDKNESKDYFIRQNIVYKYENGKELMMVPENMRKQIIQEIHNKGHYGITKTEAVISQEFYIPNLRKQIEIVIGSCIECILCNRKRGKGEGLLNPIPKHNLPLQTYHVDHLGPMPSTNKNYNYIFTVIDAFTKFTWLYPVKTTSAKEVITKLKTQQTTFGNPARIISDRGAAFTSNDFKEYLNEENIEHVLITTGIPRGNGQVERIQETLIPVLTKLAIEDCTKWYKYVPIVQRLINSVCSRSTNFTPFQLLTGVKIKNKDDLKIKLILDQEYENIFVRERENNREIAKQNIQKIQEENRKTFNRKRKKATIYEIGDLVAIQKTQFGVGTKLRPKFIGPYKIIKIKKNDRYDVQKVGHQEGPNTTSSAADHMKPWAY